MANLKQQLAEDKAMRDTAFSLFKGDIQFIREDLDDKPVGERLTDRVSAGAMDVVDEAIELANSNRAVVAASAAGGIVLWLARRPILNFLAGLVACDGTEDGIDVAQIEDGPQIEDEPQIGEPPYGQDQFTKTDETLAEPAP